MKPEDLIVGQAYFMIRYERMVSPIPIVISYEYVGTHEFLDEDSNYCCSYVFNHLPAFRRNFKKGDVLDGFGEGDIPYALCESDLGELRNCWEMLAELANTFGVEEPNQGAGVRGVSRFTSIETDVMRRMIVKELERSRRKLKILDPESADSVSINTAAVILSRILEKMIASEGDVRRQPD